MPKLNQLGIGVGRGVSLRRGRVSALPFAPVSYRPPVAARPSVPDPAVGVAGPKSRPSVLVMKSDTNRSLKPQTKAKALYKLAFMTKSLSPAATNAERLSIFDSSAKNTNRE